MWLLIILRSFIALTSGPFSSRNRDLLRFIGIAVSLFFFLLFFMVLAF